MRRVVAVLGSALVLLIGPGTVAGLVPWVISRWEVHGSPVGVSPARVVGAGLVVMGIAVLLESFARFALQGGGTPSPVLPARHLVVTGCYRYVRNPMYLAVVSVVLGEGAIIGNARLLVYGALAWLGFHVFVLAYEEPKLRKTFGAEYAGYCARVPRWRPHLRPWSRRAKRG